MRSTLLAPTAVPELHLVTDTTAAEVVSDEGMSTAEYAVGLGFAVFFAGLMLAVLKTGQVFDLVLKMVSECFKFLG